MEILSRSDPPQGFAGGAALVWSPAVRNLCFFSVPLFFSVSLLGRLPRKASLVGLRLPSERLLSERLPSERADGLVWSVSGDRVWGACRLRFRKGLGRLMAVEMWPGRGVGPAAA